MATNTEESTLPSGRGFGFSNPPSCISSKAKETFKTWREKTQDPCHCTLILDPQGPETCLWEVKELSTVAGGAGAELI